VRQAAQTYQKIVTNAAAVPPLLPSVPSDTLFIILMLFVAALKHPREDVHQSAADALVEIGPAAVPALVAARNDPDEDFRRRINGVLEQIGPPVSRNLDFWCAGKTGKE
jgi:HEAT repeat protein